MSSFWPECRGDGRVFINRRQPNMFPATGGSPSRRFIEPHFIATLPQPGAGPDWPAAWKDLVRALPWLLVVFIGWAAHWSVEEIATLLALIFGSRNVPASMTSAMLRGN
jgi:hypothetical protein